MVFAWAFLAIAIGFLIYSFLKTHNKIEFIKTGAILLFVFLFICSVYVVYNSGLPPIQGPSDVVSVIISYTKWLATFSMDLWTIGFQTTGEVVKTLNQSKIDF